MLIEIINRRRDENGTKNLQKGKKAVSRKAGRRAYCRPPGKASPALSFQALLMFASLCLMKNQGGGAGLLFALPSADTPGARRLHLSPRVALSFRRRYDCPSKGRKADRGQKSSPYGCILPAFLCRPRKQRPVRRAVFAYVIIYLSREKNLKAERQPTMETPERPRDIAPAFAFRIAYCLKYYSNSTVELYYTPLYTFLHYSTPVFL